MSDQAAIDNISIVLQRPRYPENIGAVVRACQNMGIGGLIVVDPQNYDRLKVLKMATHAAAEAVEQIQFKGGLKEALAPFHHVIGTTARLGKQRQEIHTPADIAHKIIPISQTNRIAILFGPEDRGLTNEDLRFCHDLVNIPTASFSSLNLAQAVMILCYEIFKARRKDTNGFHPRLANVHELEGMYAHLKDILIRISFINPQNPDYWMNNLKRFFSRMPLRAKEVSIVRGICRQINWYGEKRYKDGLNEKGGPEP
jgi:tRNA/rRNA methyltransferase